MPLLLEAAETINKEVGHEVAVPAAAIGPFTLATLLRGFEGFIMDMMLDPVRLTCYQRCDLLLFL